MKLRHPLALLLGGIISASSIGCAAINAVVSDSGGRPASKRLTAERMVSIGRVFENQGRYDQAEVMYRKALRLSPRNELIEEQLAELKARKAGREFTADRTVQALAMADAVSQPAAGQSGRPDDSSSGTTASAEQPATESAAAAKIHLTASSAEHSPASPVTTAAVAAVAGDAVSGTEAADLSDSETAGRAALEMETAPLPPVDQEITAVLPELDSQSAVVTLPEVTAQPNEAAADSDAGRVQLDILAASPEDLRLKPVDELLPLPAVTDLQAAMGDPNGHVELLIGAVTHGDTTETQTLAAALLGECDPHNAAVTAALAAALISAEDQAVVLAVADSQVQRGEQNRTTAEHLATVARDAGSGLQVQATMALRHFAGTSGDQLCKETLVELLSSDNHAVRAAAAATLGDFAPTDDISTAALHELAAQDQDDNVREAAKSAILRCTAGARPADAVLIRPATGGNR